MPSRKQLLKVINIQTELLKLGSDLGKVMQWVVEETLQLIDADGAAIELAEAGEMVYRATSGIAAPELGMRLRIDASLSGLSVVIGEVITCEDAELDDRVDKEACRKLGLRSMIVLPLKFTGLTVGVLKAMSIQPRKFKPQEVILLTMLSDAVAAAMYYSVKYHSDELFLKATRDAMTGLANRALFMDRLRENVARTHRTNISTGVLMVDMDGLKQINDTFGHRIGDAVIIEFSNRLREVTRDTDTAARLGGDEFGVILAPLENSEGLDSAIRRIQSQLRLPFSFENESHQLQASIGSALIPVDGTHPEELLDLADQRMYAVKRRKKMDASNAGNRPISHDIADHGQRRSGSAPA